MENEQAREKIINGILDDAHRSAREKVRLAGEAAAARLESAKVEADRHAAEEAKRAADQIGRVEREAATRVNSGLRRLRLETRESVYRTIVARCLSALEQMIDEERYRSILSAWITEAALGLEAKRATVSCTAAEKGAVSEVLQSVSEAVKKGSGFDVELSLSDGPPLTRQGIALVAENCKTAYNNQAHTRLARYETDIRKLVHLRLFQDA